MKARPDPAQSAEWPASLPRARPFSIRPRDGETLVDRFRRVVADSAGRDAVVAGVRRVSYGDLDAATDSLAARLVDARMPGKTVALLCPHDESAVIAIWAALKAAATYVPLDPTHPDGRLRQLTKVAGVGAVICDPSLADRSTRLFPSLAALVVDDTAVAFDAELPNQDAAGIAYFLHTSGSTGRPKAVMQSVENVLAHATAYTSRLRIGVGDQLPLLARYTFDAAVMDIFGALLTGATLHVLDPASTEGTELRRAIREAATTVLHCTPTLFRHLVGTGGEAERLAFETVRAVVLGGEEVVRSDLEAFYSTFSSDCVLINGLGPTECTVALQHVATPADLSSHTVPVGRPVDGVRAELAAVDESGDDGIGELVIHTNRVALGYFGDADGTAEAFGVDADGIRFYRTGDLARKLPNGEFVFAGRKDRQIKIRGHRVEPAEVEALLRAHPTVAQAAVVIDAEDTTHVRLIAYVTSATMVAAVGSELVAYLRRNLPDYAVPAGIIVVEAFPMGPTGKLDHGSLPRLDQANAAAASSEPRTPTEIAIASIFADVLRAGRVGLGDDFMALGGDSLQTLDVLARLRAELGITLSLQEFLIASTVAALAHQVDRKRGADERAGKPR
jgi:amino acid adenylation domain-containing protein